MVQSDTYKRNQLEWALWRVFRSGPSQQDKPPAVFRNRIKRLLELDRGAEYVGARRRFVFFDEEPQGRGSETHFTIFNAFTMAVALDLLDSGFKQSEIVDLLRYTLDRFEEAFLLIRRNPPAPPDLISATERPGAPVHVVDDIEYADCRVFVVLENVEFAETISGDVARSRRRKSAMTGPKVIRGVTALATELDRMGADYRKVFVMELAELAILVSEWLVKAPLVTRGRP